MLQNAAENGFGRRPGSATPVKDFALPEPPNLKIPPALRRRSPASVPSVGPQRRSPASPRSDGPQRPHHSPRPSPNPGSVGYWKGAARSARGALLRSPGSFSGTSRQLFCGRASAVASPQEPPTPPARRPQRRSPASVPSVGPQRRSPASVPFSAPQPKSGVSRVLEGCHSLGPRRAPAIPWQLFWDVTAAFLRPRKCRRLPPGAPHRLPRSAEVYRGMPRSTEVRIGRV